MGAPAAGCHRGAGTEPARLQNQALDFLPQPPPARGPARLGPAPAGWRGTGEDGYGAGDGARSHGRLGKTPSARKRELRRSAAARRSEAWGRARLGFN